MIFPRVVGYRVDLPEEQLEANFTHEFKAGSDARDGRPGPDACSKASSAKASTLTSPK